MGEPIKVTALTQLAPSASDYVITNSATGDEFVVTLRDLLPEQVAHLDARRKRVKPPTTGFNGKDAYGVPIPVFNEDDPKYIEDSQNAMYEYVYLWLLEAWIVDYPPDADTPEKKLACIKSAIPFWAFGELSRRLNEISGLRLSDVAREKKRSKGTTSES